MFRAGVGAHPARGRDRAFFSESARELVTGVTRHARGQQERGSSHRAHCTFGITVERSHGKLYDFGIKCRGSLVNPASYDTAPSSRMVLPAAMERVCRKLSGNRQMVESSSRSWRESLQSQTPVPQQSRNNPGRADRKRTDQDQVVAGV